ncbi:heterokaryon incompatibility protein-domain-containing protein [Diaporthe sp. PMI_573]|nr:heterokaryon incompatibility protein-domain-containing protein [Diaporthaceae sp. PMI_573]
MASPAAYHFPPLAEKSIRLLKLHPGLRNGLVACTLTQYDEHFPPYDALSYYWGDPKPTRQIYVNDFVVDIHEALWEFLDQMQLSQQTESWIWTDFLCLNQSDHREIGHQIPRMGYIYSEAKTTISWLGCSRSSWISGPASLSMLASSDFEGDLMLISDKVTEKRTPVQNFFAQPKLLCWTYVKRLMLREESWLVAPESSKPDPIFALKDLPRAIKEVVQLSQGHMVQPILNTLSLPYWTRAWITQEVALAKKVTLMFGGVSLDFDNFLLAYKSYFYYMFRVSPEELSKLRVPIEARAAVHDNKISFQQVVRWGQDCSASKPVDRIYGLLGLLARCGEGTYTLPSTLTGTIDYTRDLREIYWDIAFTRPFSMDPSIIDENDRMEVIEHWVDLLPTTAGVLSCPFTPESLRYADNERMTPLFRKKARLALSLVDMCREAVMIDSSILIYLKFTSSSNSWGTWPTKRLVFGFAIYISQDGAPPVK